MQGPPELPAFRYHPDPVGTGSIVPSERACACCGQSRGYVYKRSPYSRHRDLEGAICPWCIQSGRASEKFEALFADDHYLLVAGLDSAIVDEVTKRTPGYETWQGESWLAHCNDACAFLGDATKNDLRNFAAEHAQVALGEAWSQDAIDRLLEYYQPKGSPAFYRFRCLHCGQVLYAVDCD